MTWITGLTDYKEKFPCEEIFIEEEFELPEELPDIKTINWLNSSLRVDNYRMIRDAKILVEGQLYLQIAYTAQDPKNPVHTFKVSKKIQLIIQMPVNKNMRIRDVQLSAEEIFTERLHGRKVKIAALISGSALLTTK